MKAACRLTMGEGPSSCGIMTHAPTLRSERLILRPHRRDDFPACRVLWGDPDVVRHIGGAPQDAQAVWFRILRYVGMWQLLGYGMWVVEECATGAFLGEVGLLSACRRISELERVPEIGWVLLPSAWGKGIASEAVGAVLRWADIHIDAPRTRCIIESDNVASIRVAGKQGFSCVGQSLIDGTSAGIFDRPRASGG